MKKFLSTLVLTSLLAVLFVPAIVSAAACPNSCEIVSVDCDCSGNTVTTGSPRFCWFGQRFSPDNEGKAACLAASSGSGTGNTQGIQEAPLLLTGEGDLLNLITKIGNLIFSILLGIAVIMLILAGFFWVTAGGKLENVTKASDMLRNALIGVAVALAAKGLVMVISSLLNANISV